MLNALFWGLIASSSLILGGVILMMLTNSMIPESYEYSGKKAGISTVFGFALSVLIIAFEHS